LVKIDHTSDPIRAVLKKMSPNCNKKRLS
jgi:hypothetical protein